MFILENYLEDLKIKYENQITELDKYIDLKVDSEDYHAVSDAANDVRELQAKIELIDSILKKI